jgi:adenine deaminase
LAAESGALQLEVPAFSYPEHVRNSVKLARPLTAADFALNHTGGGPVEARVIGVIENQAPTQALTKTIEVADGQLVLDRATDLAKVALVERHQGTGEVQLGLVTGFGFDLPCAVASTVAHDSHHMLVVGTDDESMVVAANRLAEVGGGQIVVRRGEPIALIELPIAGLMSDQRAEVVAAQAEALLAALRACGCQLNNANMQLSLLALVVIPALRISDKGLVDVDSFRVVPVIAGERE